MSTRGSARDAALAAVRSHLDELGSSLALWATRDDTKPQPGVRQVANDTMHAIDGALRELHGIRSQLVTEMRESDDTAIVRAEALLHRVREQRAASGITAACRNGWHLDCPDCACGCHRSSDEEDQ